MDFSLVNFINLHRSCLTIIGGQKMPKVTVYSTPTCPWCVRAKEFLKENKIAYEDVNVAADQNAAQEMVEKSGQMGVPVIAIDGQYIVGFDKNAIKKALKLA
jgi:glutaredoxin 3